MQGLRLLLKMGKLRPTAETCARQEHSTSGPGARRPLGSPRRPQPPGVLGLLRPSRPRKACGASRSRAPGHTALRKQEGRGGKGSGTESSTSRARPRTPETSHPQPVPATPGGSGPRAPARAPALRRRLAAHRPPQDHVSLGRGRSGGHQCACAPGSPKHRPRIAEAPPLQGDLSRAPSIGRARDLGVC